MGDGSDDVEADMRKIKGTFEKIGVEVAAQVDLKQHKFFWEIFGPESVAKD